jgi:hemolysin D
VYAAELRDFEARISILNTELGSAQSQMTSLSNAVSSEMKLVVVLKHRAAMWQSAFTQGVASELDVMSAQQDVYTADAALNSFDQQLLAAQGQADGIRRTRRQLITKYRADHSTALSQALVQRAQLRQVLMQALNKVGHTHIIAPIDGTVQELNLTAPGRVVAQGQTLMVIVPDHLTPVVDALVANRDIGFVRIGQQAIIRFDAFPAGIYGTISGRVSQLARNAVDDPGAAMTGKSGRDGDADSASLGTATLVYPITVSLNTRFRLSDGLQLPLIDGMTATVEVRTGKRRLIDYILGPLKDAVSEGGHER